MNIFIQLGIGVGIAVPVIWICYLLQKRKHWWSVGYAGIVTVLCAVLLLCGFLKKEPEKQAEAGLTQEELITFAYAFAEKGAYAEASGLMEEYTGRFGYDEERRLFTARMYALQGEWESAEGLYRVLAQSEIHRSVAEQEYSYLGKVTGVDKDAVALIRYLQKNGKNPADYGYGAEAIAMAENGVSVPTEEVTNVILAGIAENYDTKEYEKEVSNVLLAKEYLETYGATGARTFGEEEKDEIKDTLKALNKLKSKGKGTV